MPIFHFVAQDNSGLRQQRIKEITGFVPPPNPLLSCSQGPTDAYFFTKCSGISEKMSPSELVAFLKDFFTAMTDTVIHYDGWEQAAALFEETLKRYPGDQPSQVFIQRCKAHQCDPPPEGWNGVFVMTMT